MVMCWAPDCKHYSEKDTCKFFKFPNDPKLRSNWIKLIRRERDPGPHSRICSCHFEGEQKENLPTKFIHNADKRMSFTSPEKRKRKLAPCTDVTSKTVNASEESIERVTPESNQESNPIAVPGPSTTIAGPGPSTSTAGPTIALLQAEIYFLQKQIDEFETKSRGGVFTFKVIEDDNVLCKIYTGLPTTKVFLSLYKLLENIPISYYLGWNVEKIPRIDQLLMCLMKLRQNYPHADLAQRFGVSKATVTNVVITWIHVLHEVLYEQLQSVIPSRKKNRTCLPSAFNTFTNCRIVIDCTEMAMTVPRSSMANQKATYSSYKHRNTWKSLIGVAPNGIITYVSTLYAGSFSDKKVVQSCGILEHLIPGDLVIADKGFLIKDLLPNGVNLNIPPFLETAQFTPAQVKQTESIARARIHVERAIQRMKRYKILNFVPQSLFQHAGYIVQVIGSLTNFQYPLIDEVKNDYSSSDGE